jgi:glyoxylase-like metal-dependent hydrolase (beta-lactamase superfamily II)
MQEPTRDVLDAPPHGARRPRHAVRLARELYQVAGPALTHANDANAYLLLGDEPTLLDCGSAHGAEALVANLAGLGLEPGDVRRVLATHAHYDHVSAAAVLRAAGHDVELWLHAAEREAAERGCPDRTSAFAYRAEAPPLRVDRELATGTVVETSSWRVQALHTPGHSPGSTTLIVEFDREAPLLVCGDALWGGFHPRLGSDLAAWHRSLARLQRTRVDRFVFGHGPVGIVFDAGARIAEARRQLGVLFDPWFRSPAEHFRY